MPNKEFLEQYPLYRKFQQAFPQTIDQFPIVKIKMLCPECISEQTFRPTNKYFENFEYQNYPAASAVFRCVYLCSHCESFERFFFLATGSELKWIMKVGQFPSWEIQGNPNIETLLGQHASYYKKGLVCESQGYGIGAFGYYRRIVEETIGGLLDEISGLMTGSELELFEGALVKVRGTIVTQEKIELVKDLLPAILRPDGMNPLSALHSSLSQGLHAESDEECLEQAALVREILIFLVNQVAASKSASKGFTDSMRKLLEREAK